MTAAPDAELGRLDDALRERIRGNLERFERVALEPEGRRVAAVAVTLLKAEDGDHPCFLITRRAPRLRNHGGQWALPGGSLDPGETASEAARRELREELGVECGPDQVLGLLDDYATRSGFVITPVIVFAGEVCALAPDPSEVAAAYRVPVGVLEAREVPQLRRIPESDRPVISIPMLDTHIHAPTAAILFQLREVALWGRGTRVGHFEQPVFAWR
jgi:8-oxo-dGTP pyrophosphatase MutT (NUDIX family)